MVVTVQNGCNHLNHVHHEEMLYNKTLEGYGSATDPTSQEPKQVSTGKAKELLLEFSPEGGFRNVHNSCLLTT